MVVQTREVLDVSPPRTDRGDADGGGPERRIDLLAPSPDADAADTPEHPLPPKGDSQPVVESAARAARIVAAITNEMWSRTGSAGISAVIVYNGRLERHSAAAAASRIAGRRAFDRNGQASDGQQ